MVGRPLLAVAVGQECPTYRKMFVPGVGHSYNAAACIGND
jgi:hypothetical protein